MKDEVARSAPAAPMMALERKRDQALGVAVEASYTVGEYDIVILSARQSTGSRPGCARTATASRAARQRLLRPTSGSR